MYMQKYLKIFQDMGKYIYNVAKLLTKLELIHVEISLKNIPTVKSGYFFVV